jgi:hypothetical protein
MKYRWLIVLLVASTVARAQDGVPAGWGTPEWYRVHGQNVLNNARKMVEPRLEADELEIARSVRYRVSSSPGIGAFATWQRDRRFILISAGIIQISEWLAEAFLFEMELGATGCFEEYSNYLGEKVIENTRRAQLKLGAKMVLNPITYARDNDGACSAVKPRHFTSRPELGHIRASLIEASIVFLYLHELAHHVLGHTDKLRSNQLPETAMQRQEEDAADRWAITTALRARYNLANAIPAYAFIAITGGNSLEAEKRMTHPLGIRRVLTLFDELIAHYRAHPDSWQEPPSVTTMIAELEKSRALVKAELNSLK